MSRDCCVALPSGATGLSVICDCGISWSYSLTIFDSSVFTLRMRAAKTLARLRECADSSEPRSAAGRCDKYQKVRGLANVHFGSQLNPIFVQIK